MHYNISLGFAKKLLFFIKKYYSMWGRGWGEDTRIRWGQVSGSISHPRWVWVG